MKTINMEILANATGMNLSILNMLKDEALHQLAVEHNAYMMNNKEKVTDLSSAFDGVIEQPKEVKSHTDIQFSGYVSDGIAQFAFNLYQRHGLDVNNLKGMAYRQVKAEVDRLSALPYPPSPKQKEAILNLIDELKALNEEFDVPTEVLKSLTGGQDGTAGNFIQFLYRQRSEFEKDSPASDAQCEKLAEWLVCPDIIWETANVAYKKPYPTELNPNGWKLLTVEEFKEELKAKFTRTTASEFIGQYQNTYYEWRRTRITDFQIESIQRLEERMANIHRQGVKTFAVVDGIVQEIYTRPQKQWSPVAYEGMDLLHLKQLSREQADKYIDTLKSELAHRETSAVQGNNSEAFEAKMENLKQGKRSASNTTTEHQALIDLVFGLEAVAGQENENLHESITELMVNKIGSPVDVANELYEFMDMLIQRSFIRFSNLVEMCERSTIATRILEIKYPKQYAEAVGTVQSPEEEQQQVTKKANDTVNNFMNQFNK